jgi:hypothetical protein
MRSRSKALPSTLAETLFAVDENGGSRELRIFQNWISDGFGGRLPATKEVRDEHGSRVNTRDGNTFEVMGSGERLTRI